MSSLRRILRELRRETERLARVEAGERIGSGTHRPGANERPDCECDCGSCTTPT